MALQSYRSRTDVRLFMTHYVLDRDTHEFRPTGTTVVGNPE
ncbi:MAG TPA: hypothetical protein VHL59_16770 [Thermoanaerobaculia bacterium]|nr:hypothetical protein [Thermoanaerobaculia bacterium]